uniref:Uncharacterized protein n=1 Tax=Rhizophora mucronata TaxID=61149 RepID=A0A2P2QW14_RHIMU
MVKTEKRVLNFLFHGCHRLISLQKDTSEELQT